MQIKYKSEFFQGEKHSTLQYSKILDERSDGWKYASFEGGYFSRKSSVYRHFAQKKRPMRNAKTEKSGEKNSLKSMQNVKNQFLHQFTCRGIWVI